MPTRRQLLSAALGLSSLVANGPVARAQTPISVGSGDPTLLDYLSLSPSSIANITQALPLLAGNQRLQADSLAIALPFDMSNEDQMHEWIVGMMNVALPSFVMSNAFRDDFVAITGFDVSQIDSGAEIGEPPNVVTFLRGTFDPTAVQAVQLLNGYQQREIDGRPVYSLFEDAQTDLTNPVSAMALARMNNSTILDDGTLVYAATLELIEQVLSPGSALLEQPGIRQALYTLDTPLITSAVLGPGNFMPGPPVELFLPGSQEEIAEAMEALREQAAAQDQVPIVLAAIAGDSAGGPVEFDTRDASTVASQPDSRTTFALVYTSPDDAQVAAAQILDRLATGASIVTRNPWSEMFSSWNVTPNPAQNSVLVSIDWTGRAGRAINLVFNRDLGFITG